jgi:hypothetical protein
VVVTEANGEYGGHSNRIIKYLSDNKPKNVPKLRLRKFLNQCLYVSAAQAEGVFQNLKAEAKAALTINGDELALAEFALDLWDERYGPDQGDALSTPVQESQRTNPDEHLTIQKLVEQQRECQERSEKLSETFLKALEKKDNKFLQEIGKQREASERKDDKFVGEIAKQREERLANAAILKKAVESNKVTAESKAQAVRELVQERKKAPHGNAKQVAVPRTEQKKRASSKAAAVVTDEGPKIEDVEGKEGIIRYTHANGVSYEALRQNRGECSTCRRTTRMFPCRRHCTDCRNNAKGKGMSCKNHQ